MNRELLSRRSFLSTAAASPIALRAASRPVPVGLELYSVRQDLSKDPMGTLSAVAKMGYQVVEFYAPYFTWTPDYAKEVRKKLDDLGLRCLSTHNGAASFSDAGLPKATELNQILGAKTIVMASAGKITSLDAWKGVAENLSKASEKLSGSGMRAGYHNHRLEFDPLDGKRPIEIIADNTPKAVVLQLDIGTCVEAGSDPVAWINAHPGRIQSMHCKDWKPAEGYKVLVGEGDVPWKKVIAAAESRGGLEYYLIEQEGSRMSAFETAEECLKNWKKLKSA